jgi:endonuclease III
MQKSPRKNQYNFEKVFGVFRKHYVLVPLEVFKNHPYKTLISTLLSARTRDEVTLEASKRLFAKAPNIKLLHNLKTEEIQKIIYPVGFYKTKAKHIKSLTEAVILKFKGVIPNTIEELVSLPGVGRKTANLVLNRAFDKPAIAVDTHVHRITNLLGWVHTKTPQKTEIELNKIVPVKYWPELNRLFVSIGRRYGTGMKLKKFLFENNLIHLS